MAYAAFDLEYGKEEDPVLGRRKVYSYSVVDNERHEYARHVSEFAKNDPIMAEKQLLLDFIEQIRKYTMTFGYASSMIENRYTGNGIDSDLKVLFDACNYHNIPQIVKIENGYPNLNIKDSIHIDFFKVISNPTLRQVYKGKYDNCKLDTITKGFIGHGKYKGISGFEAEDPLLSLADKLAYVKEDSRLLIELVQYKDYEIMGLMLAISEIIGYRLDITCNTQMAAWWTKIIDDYISNLDYNPLPSLIDGDDRGEIQKKYYEGGIVLEPKETPKFYNEYLAVLDVKSMYPTMIINENISPETVNCDCCKNNALATVPLEIMNLINANVPEEEKRENYWICRNYVGILPRIIKKVRSLRFEHQNKGNESIQRAIKVLINGAYGVFASNGFKYYDIKVADLTAAYGRYTFLKMRDFAKNDKYGFDIIYGDTDSIFVTSIKDEKHIDIFIRDWLELYPNVMIAVDKEFTAFMITDEKHYWGIWKNPNKEPYISGMDAIKSNSPTLIKQLQYKLVNDVKNKVNPTINLSKVYQAIESDSVDSELLKIHVNLGKNPRDYTNKDIKKIIGSTQKLRANDTVWYFLTDKDLNNSKYRMIKENDNILKTEYLQDPNNISRNDYLEMFEKRFKPQIEALGKVFDYTYDKDVVGMLEVQTNLF